MTETLVGAKVLVTGADGFIGSHLVERLVAAGAEVTALVYYNSWNSVGWLGDVPADVRSAVDVRGGDVRDGEHMRALCAGKDYVFHLASLIAIPYSYDAPRSYVETNVIGSMNVAEACRTHGVRRMIQTSTSETYGTAQMVPIPESHPLVGQSPYSASKIAADKMIESYHRSFGLPVVTARPFNTFGPRQTARAVIPTIASQLIAGKERLKLGDLSPTRDFNFATNTADGMIALALCPAAEGEVVNIGSGGEWSIGETVDMLMEITGRTVPVETEQQRIRPEKSEVHRLVCDSRRLRELTGWAPAVDFRQGLEKTVAWIEKNLDRFDPDRYAI